MLYEMSETPSLHIKFTGPFALLHMTSGLATTGRRTILARVRCIEKRVYIVWIKRFGKGYSGACRDHMETATTGLTGKKQGPMVYSSNFLPPFDSAKVLGVECERWGTAQDRHRACKTRAADPLYSIDERKGTGCCFVNGIRQFVYL